MESKQHFTTIVTLKQAQRSGDELLVAHAMIATPSHALPILFSPPQCHLGLAPSHFLSTRKLL